MRCQRGKKERRYKIIHTAHPQHPHKNTGNIYRTILNRKLTTHNIAQYTKLTNTKLHINRTLN